MKISVKVRPNSKKQEITKQGDVYIKKTLMSYHTLKCVVYEFFGCSRNNRTLKSVVLVKFLDIIKLKERAEKNKANLELIKLLAKHFNMPSSKLKIAKGLTSKQKIVEI